MLLISIPRIIRLDTSMNRADPRSVSMMLQVLQDFSSSTGLVVNPRKCRVYFGGADPDVRLMIKGLTKFQEGALPFKYLGIPMTSKRLEIHHYMPLVDKIVSRITHWSSKLLSYAGKIQLVKSIYFATANYWLQCLPLPKHVIHHIDAICRSFIWTGNAAITRKSPVAWKNVCKPRKYGGLNIIDLQIWNNIAMLKLLWNISKKKDNLWVKWINCYYLKDQDILQVEERIQFSWIFKAILRQRADIDDIQSWNSMVKFRTRLVYKQLRAKEVQVPWFRLFCGNSARPRALITLWQACHGKLATRSRLYRFGLVGYYTCCFCLQEETLDHLLFECIETSRIWQHVLHWMGIQHVPKTWLEELQWLTQNCKGKSSRASILKIALAESDLAL